VEIVWGRIALEDLEEDAGTSPDDGPAAAARVHAAILSAVERLTDLPGLGRVGRVEGTRELVIVGTPYIIAYAVVAHRIMILSLMHGASNSK